MRNDRTIAEHRLTSEQGDSGYHLRLLGVLATLVDRDVWRDALLIADLLTEESREQQPKICR
jgi:hypothetical protein